VVLYRSGGYTDKRGRTIIGDTVVNLLGILYAGPQHRADGEIAMVPVPTASKAVVHTSIPLHLGLVIKARELLDIDAQFRRLVLAPAKV
jgi:hypothetical protein